MKNISSLLTLACVILFSVASSQAQITIVSGDMPSSGSTYRTSLGQAFPGMDQTLTGTNYTWDYSQLTETSQTVDTFVTVLSTGLLNWLQFNSNSSYALKSNTPTLPLGILTLDYEYEFYKKTSSGYVQSGFGANLSGFPLPVPYSPKDTVYRFPLNYNNVGSCSSAFAVSIPGLGYYGGNKTRTDTVDGWGTLITPYGTFSAVRVKSVINETDSIHLDTLGGFGFSVPLLPVTEYKWLGTGHGIPLLQINTTAGFVTRIAYLDSLRDPLSVPVNTVSDAGFILYPSPSTGKVFIQFKLDKEEKVSVDVYDMIGNLVAKNSYGKKLPGVNFLLLDLSANTIGSGIYLVRLTAGEKNSVTRLQVSKN